MSLFNRLFLKVIPVLILINVSCKGNPQIDYYESGKMQYKIGEMKMAKIRFLKVGKNNSKYNNALDYIKKIDSIEKAINQKKYEQSIRRPEELEKTEGISGRWKFTLPGNFIVIITFKQENGNYKALIQEKMESSPTIKKLLRANNNKYIVIDGPGASVGEYFLITKKGTIEYWDEDGKFAEGIFF